MFDPHKVTSKMRGFMTVYLGLTIGFAIGGFLFGIMASVIVGTIMTFETQVRSTITDQDAMPGSRPYAA